MRTLFTLALAVAVGTAYSQSGTQIYGLKSQATAAGGPSMAPTHLYHFDGSFGGLVDVGAVTYEGNQVDADGLAWTGTGLMAFLLEQGGSRLVSIDATTAVATNVAFYEGAVMRGATFRDGTIYALDVLVGNHWNLAKIDLNTLGLTSIGLNTTIADGCDLDFAGNGDLWVAESNAFHLLNPNTGALNLIVADGVPEENNFVFFAGFVFDETAPLRSVAMDVNHSDDIYVYDTPVAVRSQLIPNIIPSFNAGRGDLAAVPEPATLGVLVLGLGALVARKRRSTHT